MTTAMYDRIEDELDNGLSSTRLWNPKHEGDTLIGTVLECALGPVPFVILEDGEGELWRIVARARDIRDYLQASPPEIGACLGIRYLSKETLPNGGIFKRYAIRALPPE